MFSSSKGILAAVWKRGSGNDLDVRRVTRSVGSTRRPAVSAKGTLPF
jgi:hypothetical protein